MENLVRYINTKNQELLNSDYSFKSLFEIIYNQDDRIFGEYLDNFRIVKVSYKEMKEYILKVASFLSSKIDDEVGSFVGLYLENSLNWIACFWALLMIGYKPVLLNTRLPLNVNNNVIDVLGVYTIITSQHSFEEKKEIIEQKEGTPLRLTKNISFFLSIPSIYGIIPGVFYSSCEALLNKPKIIKSILKLCLDNNNDNNSSKIDIMVHNYINKFKFILNLYEDNNQSIQKMKSDILIGKENQNEIRDLRDKDNNNTNKENKSNDIKKGSMKIIYELINNSMNNNNLKKKTIDYEAWF